MQVARREVAGTGGAGRGVAPTDGEGGRGVLPGLGWRQGRQAGVAGGDEASVSAAEAAGGLQAPVAWRRVYSRIGPRASQGKACSR